MKTRSFGLVFFFGGWGEIRTHGPVAQTPVFKTGAFDHSATHPSVCDLPAYPSKIHRKRNVKLIQTWVCYHN